MKKKKPHEGACKPWTAVTFHRRRTRRISKRRRVVAKGDASNASHPIFHLTRALFWRGEGAWKSGEGENLGVAICRLCSWRIISREKKKTTTTLLSNRLPGHLKSLLKKNNKKNWSAERLPLLIIYFPSLNGPRWLGALKKIHYSPPFSVNNGLSLFIPLPSSVPPSAAFPPF